MGVDSGIGIESEQTETTGDVTKSEVSKKVRFFESDIENIA